MNAQDLKANRNEIISRINEIADTTKMSEIMTAMLRIVEGGMNETNNAVELVDEVVALMGYEKKIVARDAYELNQENMRKNLPSSLR
jgi:uncharacterized protein YqgV (UPF0045/DUF77 family)